MKYVILIVGLSLGAECVPPMLAPPEFCQMSEEKKQELNQKREVEAVLIFAMAVLSVFTFQWVELN